MTEEHRHIADEQLLLHGNGELPASSSTQIQTHLERCSQCSDRLKELDSTFAEFASAHFKSRDSELPSAASAHTRLTARLAELSAPERKKDAHGHGVRGSASLHSARVALIGNHQSVVLAVVAVAACLLLAIQLHGLRKASFTLSARLGRSERPDFRLTPGATIPVTQDQVCGVGAGGTISAVPVSLKRKVFEEYGVAPSRPDAYEVDYLITPELGGATDIRNLWPEPYEDTIWNAHVKDQLEDRLHSMVCRGDVDLATAQHDISTDWIAAYRKYFHADKPIGDKSSFNSIGLRRYHPLT